MGQKRHSNAGKTKQQETHTGKEIHICIKTSAGKAMRRSIASSSGDVPDPVWVVELPLLPLHLSASPPHPPLFPPLPLGLFSLSAVSPQDTMGFAKQ